MKKLFSLFICCCIGVSVFAQATSIHTYKAISIYGDTIDFANYYGKKLMVVNTASACAYTYQYGELQDLYSQYQQEGFEIIGFPCNDFGGQDPHGDSVIEEFCTGNYGVTFQMMSKVHVNANPVEPIFEWLKKSSMNGVSNASVTWNFHKFLIDEAGHWVAHYGSTTSPLDSVIINWIMSPSVVQTGVKENALENAVQFMSNNSETIEMLVNKTMPNLSVSLYAMDGKLVGNIYQGSVQPGQTINYNLSSMASGMYVLTLRSDGLQKTIKYSVK